RLAGRPVAGEPCRVPDGSVPGGADSFDPRDLDDVRTRIVMPAATSLTRPGLLRRVDVGWGPRVPIRDAVLSPGPAWAGKSYEDGCLPLRRAEPSRRPRLRTWPRFCFDCGTGRGEPIRL